MGRYAWTMVAIGVLALALRLFAIDTNPPEAFEDEIAGATSAWRLVTTGEDFERTAVPFLVTRLEMKQPLYGLATVPFQAVLGSSPLALRLPAVLFGTASVLLTAWLVRTLGGTPRQALIAAVMMAVLPWAVHYGRIGWEPAAFLPFTIGGIGLLWRGMRHSRHGSSVAAAAVLATGAYAYHPALLVNAALAAIVVGLHISRIDRDRIIVLAIAAGTALLILQPYLSAVATDPLFTQRTREISVFRDGLTVEAMGQAWRNYWEQWNPQWLFAAGAPNLRNHPGPVLVWAVVPLLLVGLSLIATRRRRADWLLIAWLAIAPLPAAITNDGTPHFTRGLGVLPAIAIVSALGFDRLVRLSGPRIAMPKPGRIATAVIVAVAAFELATFYRYYFTTYPAASAPAWAYGASAAAAEVRENVPSGGTVCIDGPLSFWTFPHQVAYYFPTNSFTVHEGLGDQACSQQGTYLLVRADAQLPVPVQPIADIASYSGEPLYVLDRVDGR